MPKVNHTLVKKNLNTNIPYFNWPTIVKTLNTINVPANHKSMNACSTGNVNCRYPPGNLHSGVPRVLMPEVNPSVLEKLKGVIDFTEHKMTVQELADSYVAQREILLPKIKGQAEAIKAGKFDIFNNIWYIATSSDGKKVIIDGHHGWGAVNLLLKENAIDPNAEVNVVDFVDLPETVIEMAFSRGNAHSNPFRPTLVGGGRNRRSRMNRRSGNSRRTHNTRKNRNRKTLKNKRR